MEKVTNEVRYFTTSEILEIIFINQRHDLKFVFKFRKISKICKNISEYWLTEIMNIAYFVNVDIKQFRNLRKLYCSNNFTDEDLISLPHLTWLHLNGNMKITNNGIKHLSLYFLEMRYNSNITDEGIQHMKFEDLYTAHTKITDKGIVNSQETLKYLCACSSRGITNEGIKNMNLTELCAMCNGNITKEGVKHMTKCKLVQ